MVARLLVIRHRLQNVNKVKENKGKDIFMHYYNLADKLSRLMPDTIKGDAEILYFIESLFIEDTLTDKQIIEIILVAVAPKISNINLQEISKTFIYHDNIIKELISSTNSTEELD